MISSNAGVVILSDSTCVISSDSRHTVPYLMMDTVNVNVHNVSASGMPIGRLNSAPGMPIAMCDQKQILNYLMGFYDSIECLIVLGGANDWIYGTADVENNVVQGAIELGGYAHQLGIPNIVFVSMLPAIPAVGSLIDPENDPNSAVQPWQVRAAVEFGTLIVNSLRSANIHYIDGYNLLPAIPANYENDGLHTNDTGRSIWVGNLITELQTLGIFPASYV